MEGIKATELRIGNIISFHNQKVIEFVMYISNECVETNSYIHYWGSGINEPLPIPLTEEILSKTPFNKYNNSWFLFQNFTLKPNGNGYRVELINAKITTVYYLHELQNLFYVLTKKELEIRL